VYFRQGYRFKHETTWKQQGNSLNFRWQHWFNMPAASGAPITIKGKWHLKFKILLGPQRCPNLTPCDFYMWGFVKEQVYQPPIPQSLRERISQAIANVDESQLRLTWEEFECRIDVRQVTNGAYIAHFWINLWFSMLFSSYFMFVSLTFSKIHYFLLAQVIYNSPVY
jgi:hypothetical protein